MVSYLYNDYETYCDLDIKKVGMYKYINHYSFEPLCGAYGFNHDPVELWTPDHDTRADLARVNDHIASGGWIVAQNAEFECRVMQQHAKALGIVAPKVTQFIDTMMLLNMFGFPGALDRAAVAMGLPIRKDATGSRVMMKLAKPRKPTKNNPAERWYKFDAPRDYEILYRYCKQDVEVTRMIHCLLPLQNPGPAEQNLMYHTWLQNQRGLPMDTDLVTAVNDHIADFLDMNIVRLRELTDGKIRTPGQRDKILLWCKAHGLNLPNLQKGTVEEAMRKDMNPVVRAVLEIRQLTSHSSVKKFMKAAMMLERDGRIRGNLKHHKAHTGRSAGAAYQIHNMPRAKFKDDEVEGVIDDYLGFDTYDLLDRHPQLMEDASKLVRPAIRTNSDNVLRVADLSSIENRILHWWAEDTQTLEDFRNGLDQYKTYAVDRFNTTYDEVTKDERQYAKPCVLGLGFGGGRFALMRVAANYGVELDENAAQFDVNFYRHKYWMVVDLWDDFYAMILDSIGGRSTRVYAFQQTHIKMGMHKDYFYIKLPSGRYIWYYKPEIREGKYGTPEFSYLGVDSQTSQFTRHGVHRGGAVENVVQAIGRDVLFPGAINCERAGYPVIGTVHDEVIAETDVGFGSHERMCELMCSNIGDWAKNLPLAAEGYSQRRYKKD